MCSSGRSCRASHGAPLPCWWFPARFCCAFPTECRVPPGAAAAPLCCSEGSDGFLSAWPSVAPPARPAGPFKTQHGKGSCWGRVNQVSSSVLTCCDGFSFFFSVLHSPLYLPSVSITLGCCFTLLLFKHIVHSHLVALKFCSSRCKFGLESS